MAWSVELTTTAQRQLHKLDKTWQSLILNYLEDEVAPQVNPRLKGKALVGDKKGLWRYRVGNYRILYQLLDQELIIVAVTIGHRKDLYET